MQKVYIVYAKRTAVGSLGGSLQNTSAVELGSLLVKDSLQALQIAPNLVDEVILGNVLGAGLGQNVSRQVALAGGLAHEIPAFTVNKVCGSGLKALQLAYQSILLGEADCILAGGTENMNQAPYLAKGIRTGLRMGDGVLEDSMIKDGLWCAVNNYHMGITAENIADKFQISRQEQDEFAFNSQQKTKNAIDASAFEAEILPVQIKQGKEIISFSQDEHPKPNSTLEKIASLRSAFKKDGSVTAANASGINDGAALLALASEDFVKKHSLKPLAEVLGFASAGVDPALMGLGPVNAVEKLIKKSALNLNEIDLFELNEAFAVQALAVQKLLKVNPELVNVNGGAIALGHPIGASGARIAVTLLHALQKRNLKTGIASLCIGGGMGIAMLLKRGV